MVEANNPKIRAQARPEKIGSRVIGQAPRAVVARGEDDRPQSDGAGLKDRLFQVKTFVPGFLDKVDQHQRIADNDPAQGDHADHGGGGEEDRVGETADGLGRNDVQQPETGHYPQQGQGDGQHDQHGHEKGSRLDDQEDVDPDHGRAKGQAQIPEDVDRDLPLALAGPVDRYARRQVAILQPVLDVDDRFGRRHAGQFGVDVDQPLQVLVVDRLVVLDLDEPTEFGQLNH